MRYEGRSAELEQYLEEHFKDIPTKLEVKQANARAALEAELKSLQDAGIEVVNRRPLHGTLNRYNRPYVEAKVARAGHWLHDMLAQSTLGD